MLYMAEVCTEAVLGGLPSGYDLIEKKLILSLQGNIYCITPAR